VAGTPSAETAPSGVREPFYPILVFWDASSPVMSSVSGNDCLNDRLKLGKFCYGHTHFYSFKIVCDRRLV